jgi:FMN-dependent NADH-azoreductase
MWNFSIPYILKHYIDIIIQPGLTFQFSIESGYKGIVKAKSATVIYTSGGDYSTPEMQGLDFQKNYMNLALGFIGLTNVNSIVCEPTLGAPDSVAQAKEAALETTRQTVEKMLDRTTS